MDAVQEGNEGLLYRLRQKKLDREKGNLMTYFSPWVRQRIAKYYDRERHKIVIPVAKVSLARKYYKYVINFEQRNKKPPTIFQAAKHLKVSEKELEEARQAFSMKSVPSTDEHPLLLENYFGNVFPELNLSWEQKLAKVRKAVEKLPSMLRKTIKLRVGWNENEPRSLEQVGARFGVSKERVRQRELEALKLLAVLLGVDPKKIISIADVSRKKTKKKPKH
ncbi:MAG: sigma-70 family RNA polymerase sigma factor [archaeon]|nr:sigma-70 family RNA polymerase sigma factor [archaeon]